MDSNSRSVSVRRAEEGDAEEIARVHVGSWQGGYRGLISDDVLDGLSIEGRTRQWRGWLAPGGARALTLVAATNGRIVGFVTLATQSRDRDEPAGVGEVPALYVLPSAWGAGVGGALMDASMQELRRAGCAQAILWMLEGNDRAARFYAGQGWRADGGRRGSQYYPEDVDLVEVRFRREL